jgi:hypothetical protein
MQQYQKGDLVVFNPDSLPLIGADARLTQERWGSIAMVVDTLLLINGLWISFDGVVSFVDVNLVRPAA